MTLNYLLKSYYHMLVCVCVCAGMSVYTDVYVYLQMCMFVCIFLPSTVCVCRDCHGACIDVRGKLSEVSSLLYFMVPAGKLGTKCLYPLSHLAGSNLDLLNPPASPSRILASQATLL